MTAAPAFMFASTNLAVEVAAPAFIFLGWQYAAALFVGAPILVAVMAALVHLAPPEGLSRQALDHARNVEGYEMESSEGLPEEVAAKLRDGTAWSRVGRSCIGEWRMVWKELLVGFTIAGAIAALVPDRVFEAIFPTGGSRWLVLLQALVAPFLAVLTFIGSMGNGPLAATLAEQGVVFGAIMAFLYADFVGAATIKSTRSRPAGASRRWTGKAGTSIVELLRSTLLRESRRTGIRVPVDSLTPLLKGETPACTTSGCCRASPGPVVSPVAPDVSPTSARRWWRQFHSW